MKEKEKKVIEEIIDGIKELTLITVGEIGTSEEKTNLRFSKLCWVMDIAKDAINDLVDLQKEVEK